MAQPTELPQYAVVFGPKSNCTLDTCPIRYSVYKYRPSLVANSAMMALFGIACIIHILLGLRWRTWFFTTCSVLGCTSAALGYVGRVMMYYNPFNFVAFMLQIICVSSAPVYFCAAIYVTLAFAIEYLSPSLSRFKPGLFYWAFIPCDFFSLAIQASGGVLSTISSGTNQLGVNLALVGLAFQLFTMVVFCCLLGDYLFRYLRFKGAHALGLRLKLFLTFLTLAVLMIAARSAYRLVELNQGYTGRFIRDEGLFIGLEGVSVVSLG